MESKHKLTIDKSIRVKYKCKPLLQPRQVAGTFTFQGGKRMAKLMIWKPLQFTVRQESEAHHRL